MVPAKPTPPSAWIGRPRCRPLLRGPLPASHPPTAKPPACNGSWWEERSPLRTERGDAPAELQTAQPSARWR
jgi:hypothetical protein